MKPSGTIVGQQLGNYLIQEQLGRGGMARVYKGMDTMLKRPVAVKVIEEALRTSSSYAKRFEREASAVANLRHPNIVNVHYFGTENNLYYLVMEYIEGTDLDAILHGYAEQGELMPYADVMHILEAIASALDYAHGQRIIHRDVKPANIMLERTGRPVLTDFGLALKVSEGTVGETFGTPHYVSPEQARSSAAAVPQSDLYSLGVVAYELLTGALPFDDPSPTALAMQHLLAAVPSPRDFNPSLSVDVEQVLFKILAKAPQDRYETGAAFCAALRQGLESTLRSAAVQVPGVPLAGDAPATRARRLSMQSAVNIVDQELSSQQSTTPATTRPADTARLLTDTWRRVHSSHWLPYVLTTSVVAVALLLFAAVLGGSGRNEPATPTIEATRAAVVGMTVMASETPTPSATAIPPSATPLPTDTAVPPTQTPVPPSATPLPPSATPAQPTQALAAPSDIPLMLTPVQPTPGQADVEQPTAAPDLPDAAPETTRAPTAAPSDWLPVTFVYDSDGFWWLNGSSRRMIADHIRFEKSGGDKGFSGNRWAYWTLEPGRCMEIRFADVANPARPNGCRPNAFFTPTRTQDVDFWRGSGRFRVYWDEVRIAVCFIAEGVCTAFVPPH